MEHRYLCSDLATVMVDAKNGRARRMLANIEEISARAATLQTERPVEPGTRLSLTCSNCDSACNRRARVEACELREGIGYDCRIAFEEGSCWDPSSCRPAHLTDVSRLAEPVR